MKKSIALIAAALVSLTGCAGGLGASGAGSSFKATHASELIAANFDAADKLLEMIQAPLDNQSLLIVTTLANLDDLGQTSGLGRLISEHIATRFTQRGLNVAELRLASKVSVRQEPASEMMLSRDVREIAASHEAQAVMVGTFSIGHGFVYVNIKLIEAGKNRVIAAHSYMLPNGGQIRALSTTYPR